MPTSANATPITSYGQAVAPFSSGSEPAGSEADRERRQPGSPPGQVGALVREPRPPRRVVRLVELAARPSRRVYEARRLLLSLRGSARRGRRRPTRRCGDRRGA